MKFKNVATAAAGVAALAAAVIVAPNTVNSASIQDGQVKTADIGAGQVWQSQMAPAVNDVYLKTYNKTVGTAQLTDAMKTKVELGTGVSVTLAAKGLDQIGGSFKTGKTKLGEITLPAGTWLINATGFFSRSVAGPAGTRPQLALRVGASDTEFGEDYGTALGAEISPSKDRELTISEVKVKTIASTTTIEVFAFGYNDDGGSAGSNVIAASADVAAVRIG